MQDAPFAPPSGQPRPGQPGKRRRRYAKFVGAVDGPDASSGQLDDFAAAAVGTAGFTAMQCILHWSRRRDDTPSTVLGRAPRAVSGRSPFSCSRAGHSQRVVVAVESEEASDEAGRSRVVGRLEAPSKPLQRVRFDYAVDCVGGDPLALFVGSRAALWRRVGTRRRATCARRSFPSYCGACGF